MIYSGNGDALQAMLLKRSSSGLRQSVTRLTAELSSGQISDKSRALSGNLGRLADVTHGLALSARNATSAQVATTFLSAQQTTLDQVGQTAARIAADLNASVLAPDPNILDGASRRAADGFADVIGALNTRQAGRYLFAGVAGDQRPFASADSILGDLRASLPPGGSPADIRTSVDAWFAPGGPFDSVAYQAGPGATAPIDLGNGNSIRTDVTGSDPALRNMLAALAMGALVHDLSPGLSIAAKQTVLSNTAQDLRTAESGVIALQTKVGTQEARAAEARVQAEAQGAAFEILRTELLEADPFETATALEAATQRLDALYLVTARLSRLSLTEYLR